MRKQLRGEAGRGRGFSIIGLVSRDFFTVLCFWRDSELGWGPSFIGKGSFWRLSPFKPVVRAVGLRDVLNVSEGGGGTDHVLVFLIKFSKPADPCGRHSITLQASVWSRCTWIIAGNLVWNEKTVATNCGLLRTQLLPTICSRASEIRPPLPPVWSESLVYIRMWSCNQQRLVSGGGDRHTPFCCLLVGEKKPQMWSNQKHIYAARDCWFNLTLRKGLECPLRGLKFF